MVVVLTAAAVVTLSTPSERQKLLALGAALLCIALLLIGTRLWGWAWD